MSVSEPPLDPFRPGAVVGGKYVVERQLAEGGIGVIVVATHAELRHRVAIKYLQPKVLRRPALVERFKREAQLAASIVSDHVVRVYDVGTLEDGAPYMVMEYLDGEDLGAMLRRGPLALSDAIDYVLQACDAIAEAHALGIVHRDLKPENLFLAQRGGGSPIIKILDFGISKAGSRGTAAERLPRMTEHGERFGTPMYMSPEQLLSSANVDSRADIWALGVVLFELLTNDIPFVGDTVGQLAASVQSSPATPLRALVPNANPKLEAAILKCLEKEPERRHAHVAELAQELAPFGTAVSRYHLLNIQRIVLGRGASLLAPRVSRPAASEESPPSSARALPRPDPTSLDAMSTTQQNQNGKWPKAALLMMLGVAVMSVAIVVAGMARFRTASGTTLGPAARAATLGEPSAPPPAPPATAEAPPTALPPQPAAGPTPTSTPTAAPTAPAAAPAPTTRVVATPVVHGTARPRHSQIGPSAREPPSTTPIRAPANPATVEAQAAAPQAPTPAPTSSSRKKRSIDRDFMED